MTIKPTAPVDLAALPAAEFGFPGPLRDRLVGAIRNGSKTATTSLLIEYEAGDRSVVVDSDHRPVAVIETTSVHAEPGHTRTMIDGSLRPGSA